jgi:hypothetical protein
LVQLLATILPTIGIYHKAYRIAVKPGNQMEMDVKDLLAGGSPVGLRETIPLATDSALG